MPILERSLAVLLPVLIEGLAGCQLPVALFTAIAGAPPGPPKLGPHQTLVFKRPPSLVETAVMGSGLLDGSHRKEYDGDPVDFTGAGGKRIRVSYDPKTGTTKVQVTHRGFGGAEGAKRAIHVIESWMEYTDTHRRPPPSGKEPALPPAKP